VSGPIRQILVNGKPTPGRLDDTHVWGAGGLLTGDATPTERGQAVSTTEGPTVWARGAWRILAERNVNGSPLYRPVNDRTGYTDWPSWRPWADTVAFDRPGALPAYVRAAVLRLYRAADLAAAAEREAATEGGTS
jgi:hypothetical protein